ncbi:MAG: ABC transporter substrate-binding protein [Marinilabiliaceae bacterium]|nr:ABC transporter substrate-binding protein [Marinilabiliaceae bacterium]
MKRNIFISILLITLLFIFSCKQKKNKSDKKSDYTNIPLGYANGFSMDTLKGKTRLTITDDNLSVSTTFYLLPHDYNKKLKPNEIKVPCQRIICLSSTQLAYLIELDAINNVIGINSSRYLFNKTINTKVKEGKIIKVGKEGAFNTEAIAALNPDVIFVSPYKTGGYDAITHLGFPLVPIAAYDEQLPLGRAEWIKCMSLFVGEYNKADSLFTHTANEYNRLKALANNAEYEPTVFSGKMKSGVWYVAGGNSFFAHMFRDAGANYVIKNNETGAVPMDYEVVYKLAHNAKYWRVLTSSPRGFNKAMLNAEDERYAEFEAFKTGNILVCNLREKPYREESCVKPHILLADYIYHFHPEIKLNHSPVYWTKIEN